MNQQTIQKVVAEIEPLLIGRRLGKIFQLSPLSFAIDFGLREGRYLFINVEPAAPRFYLIKRRVKDLDKAATPHSHFAQAMRAKLGGAKLMSLKQDPNERVIRFSLEATDEITGEEQRTLVVQLTGRSANLFLLDKVDTITSSLREANVAGQIAGEIYEPPQSRARSQTGISNVPEAEESISAALDSFYLHQDKEKLFLSQAGQLRARLRKEIGQKNRLKENLEKDLVAHGDAQTHKHLGDLLLANIATAKREGSTVSIQDFYAEGAPLIELEVEESKSLQDEAARYFALYTKSKRAREEITARLATLSQELEQLRQKEVRIEEIIGEHDDAAVAALLSPAVKGRGVRSKTRTPAKIPGVRSYRSSDGYEVLVGRGARDNDNLTFRIARPNDLWLHTADYPGSHVVVRRENRSEIPHRTIIEAAQLAARFSQASKDSKVVVHYTPRKFLSKPRGAAPGLVRMSSFKTILVEPKEGIERI